MTPTGFKNSERACMSTFRTRASRSNERYFQPSNLLIGDSGISPFKIFTLPSLNFVAVVWPKADPAEHARAKQTATDQWIFELAIFSSLGRPVGRAGMYCRSSNLDSI